MHFVVGRSFADSEGWVGFGCRVGGWGDGQLLVGERSRC